MRLGEIGGGWMRLRVNRTARLCRCQKRPSKVGLGLMRFREAGRGFEKFRGVGKG